MSIQVKIKTVYGSEVIYPVCSSAKIFAKMLGQTSLTRSNIQSIKALGYTVEVVADQVAL